MQSLSAFIEQQLNSQQQQAVTASAGPLLVISGAGSGKTRVITTRIAYLMQQQNVHAEAILALTFTNKAAKEMKERVSIYLEPGDPLPFVGTFHAYCVRLLKRYQAYLPYEFNAILDEDDKRVLIDQIVKKTNLHKQMQPRTISSLISNAKNRSVTNRYEQLAEYAQELPDIWRAYEREKQISRCYDFDDLLGQSVRLLQNHQSIAQEHHDKVRHILIDEYQDTNSVQNTLLKLLSIDNKKKFIIDSLCAVGDEDQAIYSWRGATTDNITRFTEQFAEDVLTIKIEQNYRSVQPILQSANAVIKKNKNRNNKQLWSDQEAHDRLRCITAASERHEAALIAQAIQKFLECGMKSIGILYRSHHLSRAIEESLVRQAIPYTIIGSTEFYARKEVKDIISYARLAINPFDRTAFLRCINCPARGLGKKWIEQFFTLWNENPDKDALSLAHYMIDQSLVKGVKSASLQRFLEIFESAELNHSAAEFFATTIELINYKQYLKEHYPESEAEARMENVRELVNAATYALQVGNGSLTGFLEEITLVQDAIKAQDDGASHTVFLMSLHAAKGLEFDAVIMSAIEQGILPGYQSLENPKAIEEERRLLYVGMTRARHYLLFSRAEHRYRFGSSQRQLSSAFLSELPLEHVQFHDLVDLPAYQGKRYFKLWLGGITSEPPKLPLHTQMPPQTSISTEKTITPARIWRKNQSVRHTHFGVGIITSITHKSNGKTILSISFKQGKKQIESSFVTPV